MDGKQNKWMENRTNGWKTEHADGKQNNKNRMENRTNRMGIIFLWCPLK